jgi:hypothetical protein
MERLERTSSIVFYQMNWGLGFEARPTRDPIGRETALRAPRETAQSRNSHDTLSTVKLPRNQRFRLEWLPLLRSCRTDGLRPRDGCAAKRQIVPRPAHQSSLKSKVNPNTNT